MFGLFKTKQTPAYQTKVWKSREIAWKQLSTEALRAITEKQIPVIVFFFNDVHDEYDALLATWKVPFIRLASGAYPTVQDRMVYRMVYTVNAFSLSSGDVDRFLRERARTAKLSFIFFGHYPLPDKEREVVAQALASGDHAISFWVSIDSQLLKTFGGENLLPLLEKLGWPDNEAIENPLVTRSISRAQEKIGRKVVNELAANSEAEWFEKNYRKGQ